MVISHMILCDKGPWYQDYLISWPYDIIWFSDITSPVLRAGAVWGRHRPGAPPPLASQPPTNWGLVSSWTAVDLIQCMDLLQWMLCELWVGWQLLLKLPLKLGTSQSQVQVQVQVASVAPDPVWGPVGQWGSGPGVRVLSARTAQVGHLVMASFSQVHSQSVRSH